MPESESGLTGGSTERRSDDREGKRRERALQRLIESGRAKSPEEAEQYLEAIVHLKERVASLLYEFFLEPSPTGPGLQPYVVERADGAWRKVHDPLTVLRSEGLDRFNPRLWSLSLHVETGFHGRNVSQQGSALVLPMADGQVVGIFPREYDVAAMLSRRLTPEELQLLTREFESSYEDLQSNVRARAKELGGKHGFELHHRSTNFWDPLFDGAEKAPRDQM